MRRSLPDLHPQARALLDGAWRPQSESVSPDIEAERGAYLQTALELGGALEEVGRVEDLVVPGGDGARLRGRAHWPRVPAEALGTILWLHGGGWYVGDVDAFDRVTRQLANASGAVCVSVDYRLAPEHRYPAAVDDARAVTAWLIGDGARELGTDPGRVVVGGDSAGGNLAAVVGRSGEGLRAQLLVYPALDAAMSGDAYGEFESGPFVSAADMAFCWRTYLDGADPADPDASPLMAADLGAAAPAYIAVAGHDPLRDDGLRYAQALRAAGVTVSLQRFDDMPHGFIRWGGVADRSRELIEALAGYAREAIAR